MLNKFFIPISALQFVNIRSSGINTYNEIDVSRLRIFGLILSDKPPKSRLSRTSTRSRYTIAGIYMPLCRLDRPRFHETYLPLVGEAESFPFGHVLNSEIVEYEPRTVQIAPPFSIWYYRMFRT
jgi:hypothetical protein